MEIINKRRSVRKYLNKKIENENIELILRAAMQAPSARNQQPWRFLVCENKENLLKLSQATPNMKFLDDAPLAIIFLTDLTNLKTPQMYPQDLSASIQTAMLEAASLNIGSCWCGTYPNSERMQKVSEIFNLNDELEPFAVVAFGYPENEEDIKFVDRFDEEKVFYEKVK